MLTDTQCRNAKGKEKPYKLTDGKGLFLEVKPNGTKAWRYRFELQVDGETRESTFAIGDYAIAPTGETPDQAQARRNGRCFTLAEARDERAKARLLVKQGVNPAKHRQHERIKQEHARSITFESVAGEWVKLRGWKEITKDRRMDMLRRVVFPKIGALPVNGINAAQILDVLNTAHTKNGPAVAQEAKRTISGVFELAVSTLRAETNPVYPVRNALPATKTRHKRPLSVAEIGQFLRDLDSHGGRHETKNSIRLMWWTLCRPHVAAGAEWSEFDLESAVWRVPAERMKKGKEHVMPLPRQAVDMLKVMHGLTGHRKHVFTGRDNRESAMTIEGMRQRIYALKWNKKYSPHATRATGSTRLNEMGWNGDWIERQLAHVEPNAVRRSYNQADYFADRKRMMQAWADSLDKWVSGDGNVIPFNRVA